MRGSQRLSKSPLRATTGRPFVRRPSRVELCKPAWSNSIGCSPLSPPFLGAAEIASPEPDTTLVGGLQHLRWPRFWLRAPLQRASRRRGRRWREERGGTISIKYNPCAIVREGIAAAAAAEQRPTRAANSLAGKRAGGRATPLPLPP